jgi:hypothetical protein
VRVQSFSSYAKQQRIPIKLVLKRFREGRLPPHVGKVWGERVPIARYAALQGISVHTAAALYRAGLLGAWVSKGGPPSTTSADPAWSTPAAMQTLHHLLTLNARRTLRLREDLRVLVDCIWRVQPHLAWAVKLQRRVEGLDRRLKRTAKANRIYAERLAQLGARIKTSEVLLSENEVSQIRRQLKVESPAQMLAQRRWKKRKAERDAIAARAKFEEKFNANGHASAEPAAVVVGGN